MNDPHISIHPDTRIGPVALTVADLERSLAFYTDRLGLAVQARQDATATLGVAGTALLELIELRGAKPVHGTTGLYHFAVLLPSRADLSRALHHLIHTGTPLQGAADHLVSEALYLGDPDGNGIELYGDRPRAEWAFDAGGLRMSTDPLDVQGLLREAPEGPASGLPRGTTMGHVHLRVSSIPDAEHFYGDVLGFDLMARFGHSASFLSAGGYHHHLAVNTWSGVGAPPPPEGASGLRTFTIVVPDEVEHDRIRRRLQQEGVALEGSAGEAKVSDPAGNRIRLVSASARSRTRR
jgi:catechol 2,3-dioxygenase